MLIHSEDLEKKAIKQNDSSKVIYCCLEIRNALEMIDFHLLIASVPNSKHKTIAEIAKSFHGNDKANSKLKALKEKTQKFYHGKALHPNEPLRSMASGFDHLVLFAPVYHGRGRWPETTEATNDRDALIGLKRMGLSRAKGS